RLGKRTHLVADEDEAVDLRFRDGWREAGMEAVAMLAKLAHRPEHRDPPANVPFVAKALERRRHRCRVRVVAFIDQQEFAAVGLDYMALAASLESAEIGKGKRRHLDIFA